MNYYQYLKRRFPLYVIFGIVLALAVFTLITARRYNAHLLDTQKMINVMSLNKHKVKNEAAKIHTFSNYLMSEFNLNPDTANSEGLLFDTLDKMKEHFVEARVTVSKLEEKDGNKELPVLIDTPLNNYEMILDHLEYIESFRLPAYKIQNLTVTRDDTGVVLLSITGALAMPSLGSSSQGG